MKSKETWKYIIQTIVAILTAILTTLGVTSSLRGRLGSLEEPLNVAPAPQRRASPSLATEETGRGLPSHRHHDYKLYGRIGSFRVVTEWHYGPTEGRESPLSTEGHGPFFG